MRCSSCHLAVKTEENWVKFSCPACEDEKIIRCGRCRNNSTTYTCSKCNFEGP